MCRNRRPWSSVVTGFEKGFGTTHLSQAASSGVGSLIGETGGELRFRVLAAQLAFILGSTHFPHQLASSPLNQQWQAHGGCTIGRLLAGLSHFYFILANSFLVKPNVGFLGVQSTAKSHMATIISKNLGYIKNFILSRLNIPIIPSKINRVNYIPDPVEHKQRRAVAMELGNDSKLPDLAQTFGGCGSGVGFVLVVAVRIVGWGRGWVEILDRGDEFHLSVIPIEVGGRRGGGEKDFPGSGKRGKRWGIVRELRIFRRRHYDGREVVVTESLIRTQLHFDDANGIFDMPNSDILEGMRAIGYPTDRALTFLKNHLSPQWRFLVHTLMHCLSPKSGSWNQFPSSIATALLCLSTGRVYNFSRFILEGMIGNVKATKNKFLMYPRFLQMIVAIETADRTPRPTFGFTRKLFANMKFKWEGQPIPLTPPCLPLLLLAMMLLMRKMLLPMKAEAHPEPYSPPVSERPPSPSPTIPETEWVVPNPVSPVNDWRPWPYVPAHSPIRDPTPEPASPPAQTFLFEVPLVFGPAPRPAGYVDPDVIEPLIFGPQPRPHDFVEPDIEEPVIFGPQPRPENYLEPEDLDNIISMEDDTTHGGFHEESPVGPDDAPTPTADAAGRAEDPALLTSLSAKLDRCMGRIDSLENELGKSKKIMGGAILTLVSRVKKLEKSVKQLRDTRLVVDASAAEGDVDIQDDIDLDGLSQMASAALGNDQPAVPSDDVEEREEEEVPLRRKRSAYRRARTEFSTPAFEQFQATLSAGVLPHTAVPEPAGPSVAADKGKVPMPDLDIPAEFLAEDAQARKRLEEEQASERLVQRLRAEDLAQEDLPNVSEERAKELDDLMMRMTETD
ncbi:hypothetical protein Tco_0855338 [Tanacetum coccineum]